VRIAHLKPKWFYLHYKLLFFQVVAYRVSFSGMVVVRDAHPTAKKLSTKRGRVPPSRFFFEPNRSLLPYKNEGCQYIVVLFVDKLVF